MKIAGNGRSPNAGMSRSTSADSFCRPNAFRRTVTADEVERYVGLVKSHLEDGDLFEVAMRTAYKAALASPDLLYLKEPAGPELWDSGGEATSWMSRPMEPAARMTATSESPTQAGDACRPSPSGSTPRTPLPPTLPAMYQPPAKPADQGTWNVGPTFPSINNKTLGAKDAPACLLPKDDGVRLRLHAHPGPRIPPHALPPTVYLVHPGRGPANLRVLFPPLLPAALPVPPPSVLPALLPALLLTEPLVLRLKVFHLKSFSEGVKTDRRAPLFARR